MQKKLLTMAVAGALAVPGIALAQVEVYGFVNMSLSKFKYSGDTAGNPSVSKWDLASHASNYGIRGRENLGGGLTGWFQIEQNAPIERSNNVAITPGSRNSAVGLQGGWGNFFIGQWTTPWADLDALWGVGTVGGYGPITSIIGRRETTGTAPNPNCVNGISPGAGVCDPVESAGGVGHAFWRRISQSVFYQSPNFGGAQVKLAYQTNDGKATQTTGGIVAADPSMWSASITWAGMGGRVRVGAAIDRHKEFTTQGKTDSGWRVTGGWNFGVADVGFALEEMTYGTVAGDCEARQWGIGVAIPMGSGAIRASYAVADDVDGPYTGAATFTTGSCGAAPGAVNTANNGAKTYNIGYEHRFSKRTSLGFGFAAIKNDEAAVFTWTGAPGNQTGFGLAPTAGSDPSAFFMNMVHRF